MADVKQITVGSTTYNIGNHSSSTFVGTSNDVEDGSASSWTSVVKLDSGEATGTIFTKLSNMFKNVRYLYARFGTTDISSVGASITAAISSLNTGKAANGHSHATAQLPVATSQSNSNTTVPSSAVVYTMNVTLESLKSALGL